MGTNVPTVICVTSAHRNQGKTQLVMRLVKGLTDEGFVVGTIKHIGGKHGFDNPKVKDTVRHGEAGAKLIVAATEQELITISTDEKPTISNAIKKFPKDLDYIIVEGFSKSSYPRFVVIDKAAEIQMKELTQHGKILGVTGAITQDKDELSKLDEKYPIFEEKDVSKLLTIVKNQRLESILKNLPLKNCGECGFENCEEMAKNLMTKKVSFDKCPHTTSKLNLKIDGESIYVKDFVQNIIRKSIEGMIQTLKSVPRNPQKIEITIESDAD